MTLARKLVLIAAGYAAAIAGGVAAVMLNEFFMPPDVSQSSGGMVAFGDMILFVLVTGALSLVPLWFTLKLIMQKAPRVLLALLLLIALLGPLCWLMVAGAPDAATPKPLHSELSDPWLGTFIVFIAIPRMVAGPIVLALETAAFFLFRHRGERALLIVAALMDIIPLGLFALHMLRAAHG